MFYLTIFSIGIYGFLLLKFGSNPFFQQLNDYIIRRGSSPTMSDISVLMKNLILPFTMLSLFFVLMLNRGKKNLFLFGIIILTLFGQFYFLNKYLVIGEQQFLYPKNPVISFLKSKNSLDRFLAFRQPMEENISMYAHIYSAEGANPIFPRRYGELLFAIKNNGKISKDIPRIEARLSELGDKENPFEDYRRLRLMSLLGIKHVLYFDDPNLQNSDANNFPQNLFKPVWQYGNWYGLEHINSFPRVFLAGNSITEKDPQKILDLVFNPKIDLLNTVILEEEPPELIRPSQSKSISSIKSYEPQEVVILTKSDTPQILFLSDNYYPGWKAYVDDKETKIYRANYTFRSVYLPEGKHTLTFKYDPPSFKIGFIISVLSITVIMTLISLKNNKIGLFNINFIHKGRLIFKDFMHIVCIFCKR